MVAAASSVRTVLIATGATGVRSRFADALRQAGHQAVEAARTSDLLGSLENGPGGVDLLLIDLGLVDGEGISLVQRVRERSPDLPIIVFSGSLAGAADVPELLALGVTGYVNEHSDIDKVLPSLAPHLFPDSFNRRSSARVVLAIPVSYRFDDSIVGALTLNIGKGGLAIGTMSPLPVSSQTRARFRLPGSDHEVETVSRVVWADRRVGMGLQFEQVDASDQTAIDEYVDQHLQRETEA